MRHHLPPRGVLIIGGVLIVAWLYFRRRARAAEAAATNANTGGIALSAIPASFTYLSSAAPAPTDRPIGSLNPADAAVLEMLQTLTANLVGSKGGAVGSSGGTVAVHKSSFVPHPITIGSTTVMGQLTEGGKGETEFFTSRDQGVGGLPDWKGPGHYTRVKTQAPDGSGQNTIWIYAGP